MPARRSEHLSPGAVVEALAELADLLAQLLEMAADLAPAHAAAAEAQRPGRADRVLEIHGRAGIGIARLLEQRDAGAMEL